MIFHNYKYCFLPFQFPKPSPPISSQLTNPPSSKWPPSRLPELLAGFRNGAKSSAVFLKSCSSSVFVPSIGVLLRRSPLAFFLEIFNTISLFRTDGFSFEFFVTWLKRVRSEMRLGFAFCDSLTLNP
ncbi:hypothetical protein Csa_003334 [Cucumis sativus]|uniref:Uncharacterized protein n=1 Tax=Cucumis sativus TaxID=3659 RepID=A0A0A0KKE6_CUCSA|nr:hypothetical protein Csa_003334 [Cucumis sativus]